MSRLDIDVRTVTRTHQPNQIEIESMKALQMLEDVFGKFSEMNESLG